jgi:hypothetical protein
VERRLTLSLLFPLFSPQWLSLCLSLSSERREFMERARVRVGSAADALREDTRHQSGPKKPGYKKPPP